MKRKSIQDRFWERVDKRGPDECWPWKTAEPGEYGRFFFNGAMLNAHRVGYMISTGQTLPPEVFVCHRCDNRSCCNLSHLFLGTAGDNNRDAKTKGRHSHGKKHGDKTRGEKNGMWGVSLRGEQSGMWGQGHKVSGERNGMYGQGHKIRAYWDKIDDEGRREHGAKTSGEKNGNAKVGDEERQLIVRLRAEGWSIASLARRFGRPWGTVDSILRRASKKMAGIEAAKEVGKARDGLPVMTN